MPRFLVVLLTICCLAVLLPVIGGWLLPGAIVLVSAGPYLLIGLALLGVALGVLWLIDQSGRRPAPRPDPRTRIAPGPSAAAPRATPAPTPTAPLMQSDAAARSARIDAGLDAWRREIEAARQRRDGDA